MSGYDPRGVRSCLPGGVAAWVALMTAAALVAVSIDLPLQRVAAGHRPPGVVRDYFNATEAFGNGFGVAMIVLAVFVLDPTRRVQTGRLLAASLGAGIAADVVKVLVARTRPSSTDLEGLATAGASGWQTFVGLLPLGSLGSGGQSFPSAHTATAVGLAVALAAAYPCGRRMFYSFAAGVALQRVCVGAHFLSDVLAGAALGAAWGYGCAVAGPAARRLDRVEAWWAGRFGWQLPQGVVLDEPPPSVLRFPVGDSPATSARRAA